VFLSPTAAAAPQARRPAFDSAEPFRHLVMDDFLDPGLLAGLEREFPAFERGSALDEHGGLGGKSVVERIRELGPAYAALDDAVRSPAFLQWLAEATGIPDLRYDPWYFGGGTHENRDGQELDPHVDFNRHPETGWHRRLNLIVYLNDEWQPAWGGELELHSNPRSPDDRTVRIAPLRNRAVIFETTESSWHGFRRIALPRDRRATTRRSIALYFYTDTRPARELGAPHSTIYIERPLPAHLQAGRVLDADDVAQLHALVARRDSHIQRLQHELARHEAALSGRDGGWRAHAGRFAQGTRRLFDGGEGGLAARLKSAYQPFVANLPAPLRRTMRSAWRAWQRRTAARHATPADIALAAPTHPPRALPAACALCAAGDSLTALGDVPMTQPGLHDAHYRLLHCRACDTVRLDPAPDADTLRRMYEGAQQFTEDAYTDPARVESMLAYYGDCVQQLGLMPANGESLEVGAGRAWLSRVLKGRSGTVHTVAQDVSGECAPHCPWVDEYVVGPVAALAREPRFGLVSLTHVIEHVTDPDALLAELAARLAPGGRIFLTAPARPRGWTPAQGLEPWLRYSYLHVPAHVSYLSRRWLEQSAARHGLRLAHWDDTHDDDQVFEAVLARD
jgi:SAM-dependent methyltransferase